MVFVCVCVLYGVVVCKVIFVCLLYGALVCVFWMVCVFSLCVCYWCLFGVFLYGAFRLVPLYGVFFSYGVFVAWWFSLVPLYGVV